MYKGDLYLYLKGWLNDMVICVTKLERTPNIFGLPCAALKVLGCGLETSFLLFELSYYIYRIFLVSCLNCVTENIEAGPSGRAV